MSTEKDIRDYLHYYIGAECLWEHIEGNFGGNEIIDGHLIESHKATKNSLIKPILYRLEDMPDEDAIELVKLSAWKQYGGHPNDREYKTYRNSFGQIVVSWGEGLREKNVPATKEVFSPEELHYLLKKGYDLFGLVEAGLALDKKSRNEKG